MQDCIELKINWEIYTTILIRILNFPKESENPRTYSQCRYNPSCVCINNNIYIYIKFTILGCIQKFPDWPPGARTANGRDLCESVY
jgi:hypothetical protein